MLGGPVMERPTVFLLVGLTGAGKTTYARRILEPAGVVRLSLDEEVFAAHGRYGVDYPEAEYPERERPVARRLRRRLAEMVGQGRDVVLDQGLWTRALRDEYKELVEEAGGRWRLLYFPVAHEELLRRLSERNAREDANALTVTEDALGDFIARFEEPQGEGEEVVKPGDW